MPLVPVIGQAAFHIRAMFDINRYRNLVPCLFEDAVRDSVCALKKDFPNLMRFFPKIDRRKTYQDISRTSSWKEFHKVPLLEDLVPELIESTSDGLSVEGIGHVPSGRRFIFISNHRDTCLDCALIGYALLKSGKSEVQPVLGSNLTDIPAMMPYFALCGGITIDRSLETRALYEQSLLLSRYVRDAIESDYSSIWIAEGAGRSKDGVDALKPSVIKMLMLARDKGETLDDFLKREPMIPVSISYERDPNDVLKSYAIANAERGYVKTRREEIVSILRSLECAKGRISICFSEALDSWQGSVGEFSSEIERRIIAGYRLYPVNWYAYDRLSGSNEHMNEYDKDSMDARFARFALLGKRVWDQILRYYANPVVSAKRIGSEKRGDSGARSIA